MIKLCPIVRDDTLKKPISLGKKEALEALEFHKGLKSYEPTRLVELKCLAESLGIGAFFVKDESSRFGLNAFKGLGGSFAMHKLAPDGKSRSFVTATDGNHGRGVAWAAKMMGHEAYVYLPEGSSDERLENIKKLGANAEITSLDYDDTVRYAAKLAEANSWILIQDTAWEGYERIPALIMQGYTTMAAEIFEQLGGIRPTHVFLQAGVGAMAAAVSSYFADVWQDDMPVIVTVEPEGADCIYRTALAADGALHPFEGEMKTIMAGLCCGEPCTIAWDILNRCASFAVSCPDSVAAEGMRLYAKPMGDDERIVSGESGAVTGGLVAAVMSDGNNADIRKALGLDEHSVVLCISTEGDTDRKSYADIVFADKEVSL